MTPEAILPLLETKRRLELLVEAVKQLNKRTPEQVEAEKTEAERKLRVERVKSCSDALEASMGKLCDALGVDQELPPPPDPDEFPPLPDEKNWRLP
jgi:hypothetical protein